MIWNVIWILNRQTIITAHAVLITRSDPLGMQFYQFLERVLKTRNVMSQQKRLFEDSVNEDYQNKQWHVPFDTETI